MAALAMLSLTSCQKENSIKTEPVTSTPVTKMTAASSTHYQSDLYRAGRKIDKDLHCYGKLGPCSPDEIVVIFPNLNKLRDAGNSGGAAVKQLFSDEATALTYIPDWNKPEMANVKAAILSGNYTFIMANPHTFLLGKEGVVSTEIFDYVLPVKY